MPTIYSFGDSFSGDFDYFFTPNNYDTLRYDYIHNHLNGVIPKTYAKLISEKLGYDYVCKAGLYGYEGNCNQSMFNNFFLTSPQIKENDIVFFGYTNPARFKWYDSTTNKIITLLPNSYPSNIIDYERKAFDCILINRDNKLWCDEYRKTEILIEEFAKCRNFKVFFWSYESNLYKHLESHIKNNQNWLLNEKIIGEYKHDLNGLMSKYGKHNILHETNEKNPDSHFGKIGHTILSELFLNELFDKNLI